jgi:hypothetical protein
MYRTRVASSTSIDSKIVIEKTPFEFIIPFLSEHIQKTDQLLLLGAKTDFALKLAEAGYGMSKTGLLTVVDTNEENLQRCKDIAASIPSLREPISSGRLRFQQVDYTNMPDICKQSCFDAIVDYLQLGQLIMEQGKDNAIQCIDNLQTSLRLGNPLVCISTLESNIFSSPFNERFGNNNNNTYYYYSIIVF